MPRFLRFAGLILIGSALPLLAVPPIPPPIDYAGTLHRFEKNFESDIPEKERFYIIGPDVVMKSDSPEEKPVEHLVVRALKYQSTLTLNAVLKQLSLDQNKPFNVIVYRENSKRLPSLYRMSGGDPSLAAFLVRPRDMIRIIYEDPRPVTVTTAG